MSWHPDVPELDIPKPRAIEEIESLGDDVLNAMDTVEIDHRIESAAKQMAHAYVKKPEISFEGCVDLIAMALSVTGNALGGRVGAHFVAKSKEAAEQAAHEVYD